MSESSNSAKFLNPGLLHHQKLGLELKCPLCLNLLSKPVLLPCNHIFCRSTEGASECSVCKRQCTDRDTGRVPQQSPPPSNTFVENGIKVSVETPQGGNSSNWSLTTTKRFQAPLNYSAEAMSKLTGKSESDKSTPPITSKVQCAKHEEPDTKGMKSAQKKPAETERLVESNSSKAEGAIDNTASPGASEIDARDGKRRKKSNHGFSDMDMKSNRCIQPNVLRFESVTTLKLESQFAELSGAKAPTIPDSSDTKRSICAFCQSSDLTDRTGPMLHYDKGKEVTGRAVRNSKVIHVHKTCIEWTPQVYFVGETVKNLKAEVARAAKLKCSRCGLRGAALGCFEMSCHKSYHVPCAVEIEDCRWDVEDFLVLCPSHSESVKFPREKAQFGKHASEKNSVATEITFKQSNFCGASDTGMKKWVFCGSALSSEEKYLLVKFASICGATVTKFWKSNITHVVAATDAKGACSRTLKVLKAILHGRWILNIDWIKACMDAMHPVDEEPYEVSLDNHGCCDGPKTGRLRALGNVPKLFNGLKFYFSGDFAPAYKQELLDLVITAGGTIHESKEQLLAPSYDARAAPSVTLVVYNDECTQDDEDSAVLKRREAADNLAYEIRSKVIAHTWLLESIAAQELQPLAF